MTDFDYAQHLEKKLVDKFKEEFFKKFEYYPIVLTKENLVTKDDTHLMSLEELKGYFTPFLPERFGKVLTLDAKCRVRDLVELRSIFCFLARSMKYSLTTIGEFLNGKDHTTVIHSIKTFNDLTETCTIFQEKYNTVLNYIKSQTKSTYKHESPTMEYLPQVQD